MIVNYDRKTFIVQATGVNLIKLIGSKFTHPFCKLDHFIAMEYILPKFIYNGLAYKKE